MENITIKTMKIERAYTEEEKRRLAAASFIRGVAHKHFPSEWEEMAGVAAIVKDKWPGDQAEDELFEAAFLDFLKWGRERSLRGGYWRTLSRAAKKLNLEAIQAKFEEEFHSALRRLKDGD